MCDLDNLVKQNEKFQKEIINSANSAMKQITNYYDKQQHIMEEISCLLEQVQKINIDCLFVPSEIKADNSTSAGFFNKNCQKSDHSKSVRIKLGNDVVESRGSTREDVDSGRNDQQGFSASMINSLAEDIFKEIESNTSILSNNEYSASKAANSEILKCLNFNVRDPVFLFEECESQFYKIEDSKIVKTNQVPKHLTEERVTSFRETEKPELKEVGFFGGSYPFGVTNLQPIQTSQIGSLPSSSFNPVSQGKVDHFSPAKIEQTTQAGNLSSDEKAFIGAETAAPGSSFFQQNESSIFKHVINAGTNISGGQHNLNQVCTQASVFKQPEVTTSSQSFGSFNKEVGGTTGIPVVSSGQTVTQASVFKQPEVTTSSQSFGSFNKEAGDTSGISVVSSGQTVTQASVFKLPEVTTSSQSFGSFNNELGGTTGIPAISNAFSWESKIGENYINQNTANQLPNTTSSSNFQESFWKNSVSTTSISKDFWGGSSTAPNSSFFNNWGATQSRSEYSTWTSNQTTTTPATTQNIPTWASTQATSTSVTTPTSFTWANTQNTSTWSNTEGTSMWSTTPTRVSAPSIPPWMNTQTSSMLATTPTTSMWATQPTATWTNTPSAPNVNQQWSTNQNATNVNWNSGRLQQTNVNAPSPLGIFGKNCQTDNFAQNQPLISFSALVKVYCIDPSGTNFNLFGKGQLQVATSVNPPSITVIDNGSKIIYQPIRRDLMLNKKESNAVTWGSGALDRYPLIDICFTVKFTDPPTRDNFFDLVIRLMNTN